jgi:hypothetical protein
MNKTPLKLSPMILIATVAVLAAGCWTVPNANVQPAGTPGLIQDGIVVDSVLESAVVSAKDDNLHTITLTLSDGTSRTYAVAPDLKYSADVHNGQTIKAKVTEQLAVYLLSDGALPDGSTAQSLGVNARVLTVDPSYRLLAVQYPNGQSETFKPAIGTKMELMAPGDSVVIRPGNVTAIKILTP